MNGTPLRVGDKVRLSGWPDRYPWMAQLETDTGIVKKLDTAHGTDIPIYGVSFAAVDGLLWFGASYLEQADRRVA